MTNVFHFPPQPGAKYETFEEKLLNDAVRMMERGDKYMAEGNEQNAEGCYRKALKKYEKYHRWMEFTNHRYRKALAR